MLPFKLGAFPPGAFTTGILVGLCMAAIGGLGYFLGSASKPTATESNSIFAGIPSDSIPPELLRASATHGASNLAIATGAVDENAEGFFALDFLTGDLKGWVYNPRTGAFGAAFYTNVQPQLGQSRNPEYLLVTGGVSTTGGGSNVRPAGTLVYVVDVKSGFFAAYAIPWDRTAQSSGFGQQGAFVLAGGGQLREPQGGVRRPANPAAGNDPNKAPAGNRPPAGGANPPANPGANNPGANDPAGANDPFGLGNAPGNAPGRNPNAPANPRNPK